MTRFTMVKGFFTERNLLLRIVKVKLVYSNIIIIDTHSDSWCYVTCLNEIQKFWIYLEIIYNYYYYLKNIVFYLKKYLYIFLIPRL